METIIPTMPIVSANTTVLETMKKTICNSKWI